MQRISGRYSIRSQSVNQLDWQIKPLNFVSALGYRLPVGGPFTQINCDRGIAVLYVSQPGEVPLYYSLGSGWIYWNEQQLALPGKAIRINQGECVIWNAGKVQTLKVDELPRPPIDESCTDIKEAIAKYTELLIEAVNLRLANFPTGRVAVSQSGGIDSLMITWALQQLGREVVSLTVCTSLQDPDIAIAHKVLPQMGDITHGAILIPKYELQDLLEEAALCYEKTEINNLKMAIGNILMARECSDRGIPVIFNGHAQDDLQGQGGLALGTFNKKHPGTESERWRDARIKETEGATGMLKMFSTTFRRYGIEVRMPYYDNSLLTFAFSRSTAIFPVHHAKPFARAVACSCLPPGPWNEAKYNSTGYITGAGYYEDTLRDAIEQLVDRPKSYLRAIKQLGWQAIAQLHR